MCATESLSVKNKLPHTFMHSTSHATQPWVGKGRWAEPPSTAAPCSCSIFPRRNRISNTIHIYAMHIHTHKKTCLSREHFGEKQLGYITHIQRHREIYIGFLHLIYFAERNFKVFGIGGFLWTNIKPPDLLRKVQPSFDMLQHTHSIASALDMQREGKNSTVHSKSLLIKNN